MVYFHHICGPSLTETSLCSAWLYNNIPTHQRHRGEKKRPESFQGLKLFHSCAIFPRAYMSEISKKERHKVGEWHLQVIVSEWHPQVDFKKDIMSLGINQPVLEGYSFWIWLFLFVVSLSNFLLNLLRFSKLYFEKKNHKNLICTNDKGKYLLCARHCAKVLRIL